ncbi:uncharacterized protein PpBr36_05846 [Pyricularia pennisetigena]|uniref:uncharacterized protein n=1 Tax=Pyricularia pennisetigena TaxID=1578925 RepID=UPI001153601D|nr:uncharacterized protein PpBr36_05846 [Pyricularia pennisetigena]TLS23022.1 hypothetical protein PpBr36_05846 [Pyricularia pennisetigena]
MASSLPTQLAETIQTAHIKREPSPSHDINPSTAADKVEPLSASEKHHDDVGSIDGISDPEPLHVDEEEEDEDDEDDEDFHALNRRRRRANLPPMPDLRFEQSYLRSISNAKTWYKVAFITVCDQVMMPLLQGTLYNLAWCGWQYWNKTAQIHGSTAGARLRRWWYGVNNWKIPPERRRR